MKNNSREFSVTLGLGVMLLATLLLFDLLTQIQTMFILKLFMAMAVTGLIVLTEDHVTLKRGVRLGTLLLGVFIIAMSIEAVISAVGFRLVPVYNSLGLSGHVWYDLWHFDHKILGVNGIGALIRETYAYAVTPTKVTLHNSQWLYFIAVWLCGSFLNALGKHQQRGVLLLLPLGIVVFLWFLYFDIWAAFTLYFIGYGLMRFSVKGKNFIFGWVLPIVVPLTALALTTLTPVNRINEALKPFIIESNMVRTDLEYALSTGDFNLGRLGFYPLEDRLGGPITLDKQLKFRIETKTPLLYLRGRVLKKYDGKMWVPEKEAVKDLQAYYLSSLYDEKSMVYTIKDLQFKTNVVLAPLGVNRVSIAPSLLKQKYGQVLVTTDFISKIAREGYTVNVSKSYQMTEGDLSNCLTLPANYSPRVKALTQKVIAEAVTPKDKMDKIRQFLLQNYTYSLSTTMPGEYDDFVEYFLTTESQGYCTYFASATAVMGRVAGVPTRYVEGFLTPKEIPIGRAVPVTGERAHAWVEAWIDNKWQVVESTPAYVEELIQRDEALPTKEALMSVGLPKDRGDRAKPDARERTPKTSWEEAAPILSWTFFAGAILLLSILGNRWAYNRFYTMGSLQQQAKRLSETHLRLIIEHYDLMSHSVMTPRELLQSADEQDRAFGHLRLVEFMEKSLYDSKGVTLSEYEIAFQMHGQFLHDKLSLVTRIKHRLSKAWRGLHIDGNHRKDTATKY